MVLHFLPFDASVLAAMERLDDGDCARFLGREETDGEIRADDGAFVRLNSTNHRYVLLEGVRGCS